GLTRTQQRTWVNLIAEAGAGGFAPATPVRLFSVPLGTIVKMGFALMPGKREFGAAVFLVWGASILCHQLWSARLDGYEGPKTLSPKSTNSAREAVDLLGDSLPLGARARMGTARLRHGAKVSAVSFSRDGKMVATLGAGDLCLWETA